MNISINNKIATIVGGSVAAVAIIVGGTVAYNNHKAAEAKKAAELAYANRPIVEDACVMNGYGKGSCDFTNVGKTAGAVCGVIQVDGPGTTYSNKFCSGMVQPQTTTKVEFHAPTVEKLCSDGFKDWREVCEFTFMSEGESAGSTVGA
jgi:hypothetical protein